jgi:hypothetical protein
MRPGLIALVIAAAGTGLGWETPSRTQAADAPAVVSPAKGNTPSAKPATKPATKPAAVPDLSPELASLRDHIRRTLVLYFHEPINTADNTPAEVLQFCLAFGCDTEIRYGGSAGTAMSGIGCLCWGYPCGNYQLLLPDQKRIMARIGYGFQEQPCELLAMLAQSGVPAGYEMRLGARKGTVADLVESEKLDCRTGSDLSLKLIALSYYIENGHEWKNRTGEPWTVERLVQEELSRAPAGDNCDTTNRLLGLSYAVQRQVRAGKPLEGQFLRAQTHVAECQEYAFRLQNFDGSWHPAFFAAQGASNDGIGSLRSTGYIVEWLAYCLSDARLEDHRLLRSVEYLATALESLAPSWNVAAATPREMGGVMHAVHALRIYDHRVFKPRDPTNATEATPAAPAEAPKGP